MGGRGTGFGWTGSLRKRPGLLRERHVTKPCEFIGFGAMEVTKPYRLMGFGAMEVTKPYEFIWIEKAVG